MKCEIVSMRLKRRYRLRSRLLLEDPTRRRFWRFLKNQMNATGCITGAYDSNGTMVFQQHQIEDAMMEHFSEMFEGSRSPVYLSPAVPDLVETSISDIDSMLVANNKVWKESEFEDEICSKFTLYEIQNILENLPNEKAVGIDQIPNELLKNSSEKFRLYLLAFLNNIIEKGEVPMGLNDGKCVLIHKGGDSLMPSQYRPITAAADS